MLSLARGRFIVATCLLFCAAVAHGAVAPQRIATAIDGSQMSALPNNVHPSARRATDLGAAPGNTPLTELTLRFNMTAAQQAELTQLLSDQQNPASPRYHQWLTPEQFGAEFGIASADVQKISSWLTSQGFTVTEVARGGTFIRFSGTVAQASNAFHTQIHSLSLDGENHFANLTDPALPAAIAAVTNAITGLHDFRLKSRLRVPVPETAEDGSKVAPRYTSAASGNHFVVPGDFYTIYDENRLFTQSTPINGSGVTIAVVGRTNVTLSDIATFRSLGGLSVNAPVVTPSGGLPDNDSGDLLESELDLEWAGTTAPSATVLFYTGSDVFGNSLTKAIEDNIASIISVSYGECESQAQGDTTLSAFSPLLEQANSQGQTVVASAGDQGATDCENPTGTQIITSATHGLAVDFPAASPNVTAIGGTMFNDATGTYWGPSNGNSATALSYIPELPWNESVTDGELSAGGGGVSIFFSKPAWQVGNGVPADASRDVPDVSLNAALSHDATLICTPGFCTNGTYKDVNGNHDIVGGTSVGAPEFAGLLALVVQKTGGRIGNANPTIYALANSGFYSNVFHDVTSGNNASACTTGSTGCPGVTPIGYNAAAGYDLATGWGSVDAFNMVTNWSSVTPLVPPIAPALSISTTSLSGSPTSVTQGTNINFTARVSGSSGTPTGTVQFLFDNVVRGAPVIVNAGVAVFSLNTTTEAYGVHTMAAAYSGDATFLGSKGSLPVTITSSGVPDFTLTPSTSTVTVSSGNTASGAAFTVTGLNSFTGNVTLTASAVTNVTAVFSPATVTLSNTKTVGTSTLTLEAFAAKVQSSTSASLRPPSRPWYGAGSGVALAGLLMLVLPKRRRFMGALVAVLSVGLLAVSGCGGGGVTTASTIPTNSTTPGTYTVTVTASGTSGATAVTHTATVTFVVQ